MSKLLRWIAFICLAGALVALPTHAWAHSGGTDANGCHTDSSTGTRHCHGGGDSSSGSTSSSSSSSSDDGGLSDEAVLGIVIGAVLAATVLLGFAIWAVSRQSAGYSAIAPDIGAAPLVNADGEVDGAFSTLTWRF